MATHAQGRVALDAAWRALFRTHPTRRELQIVGAVAALESGYGDSVYRQLSIPDGAVVAEFRGTNNWGAIQCCMPDGSGTCPEDTFPTTDKSPSKVTPENPLGYYDACFKRFATPADGALGFLHVMLKQKGREPVRLSLASGSSHAVAQAMHDTRYEEAPVASYALAIQRNAAAIAASLREPLEVSPFGIGILLPPPSVPGRGTVPSGTAPRPSARSGDGITALFVGAAMWYMWSRRKP